MKTRTHLHHEGSSSCLLFFIVAVASSLLTSSTMLLLLSAPCCFLAFFGNIAEMRVMLLDAAQGEIRGAEPIQIACPTAQ
jgi:hypothetical protein